MKAVIMAGGKGSRLMPVTCDRPKPLTDIMGKPVMHYILCSIRRAGIREAAVTLRYMPGHIIDFLNCGKSYDMSIEYFMEREALGTAGSVKNAEEFINSSSFGGEDDFLVMSGDCLTDFDLSAAISFHKQRSSDATLILSRVRKPLEYGVVVLDEESRVTRFLEKPSWPQVFSDTVNTGIYILNKKILGFIEKGRASDFGKDIFPLLLENKLNVYGYISEGYWCDIGDVSTYAACHRDILQKKINIDIPCFTEDSGIYLGKGVNISNDARINPPCFIGDYSFIGKNCEISPLSVIGRRCRISDGSVIRRSVIQEGCMIGSMSVISGAVLCSGVSVGSYCSVGDNAVIGRKAILSDMCEVKPKVKIWAFKDIPKESLVNNNLVFENNFMRELFADAAVSGNLDTELNPEFSAKLGLSFASVFPTGGKVGISYCDGADIELVKNSFAAGVASGGLAVFDLGIQVLPALPRAVRFFGLDGGVHILKDENEFFISFFDSVGILIGKETQRKIEHSFIREDYTRCASADVKELHKTEGSSLGYLRDTVLKFKNSSFAPVGIDSCSEIVIQAVSYVCAELGIKFYTRDFPENLPIIMFNSFCEIAGVQDERGRVFSKNHLFTAFCIMLCEEEGLHGLAVHDFLPQSVLDTASGKGINIILSKTGRQSFMSLLHSYRLFKQLDIMFDGIYAMCSVLKYISERELSIADFFDSVPEFFIQETHVFCPAEMKASVMSAMVKEKGVCRSGEGIKIICESGWAFILPHCRKPLCKVICEAPSDEKASELCSVFRDKIEKIVSGNNASA